MLEFAFGEIAIPVGRVQYLQMHPMTFYEYLLALGKPPMAEQVLISPGEADPAVQKMILAQWRNYVFVGGMPECVKTYRNSGSMIETFQVQAEIINA